MGLDMYLGRKDEYGKEGVNWYRNAHYWRKANSIHNFFVRECGDGIDACQPITVRKADLDSLREHVTDALVDLEHAEDHLPTLAGLFFGPTAYDDWYVEDLHHTVNILNSPDIKDADEDAEWIYQASW